jgi:hypothetical protein
VPEKTQKYPEEHQFLKISQVYTPKRNKHHTSSSSSIFFALVNCKVLQLILPTARGAQKAGEGEIL